MLASLNEALCPFVFVLIMSTQIAFSQAWRGVDVSFLPEMEGDGVIYQDAMGEVIEDPRAWMAGQGVNLVRLRVCRLNPNQGLHAVHGWRLLLRKRQSGMRSMSPF